MGNKSQWMAVASFCAKKDLENLYFTLRQSSLSIGDLFGLNENELHLEFPSFSAGLLTAIVTATEQFEDIQERYSGMLSSGIEPVFFFEESYPKRLQPLAEAPAILYCVGNPALLSCGGAAMLAPAEISLKGEAIARRGVQLLASHQVHIIAGLTRHSGTIIHAAAIQHGTTTAAILPCGILQFTLAERLRPFFDPERFCIASPFEPESVASAENARYRNRLIATLADAVYIIECADGSLLDESASFCVKQQIPLYVSEYSEYAAESSANARLISELGAHPVRGRKNGNTIDPNIDHILGTLRLARKSPLE